jgi:signal transduction histidine kinase
LEITCSKGTRLFYQWVSVLSAIIFVLLLVGYLQIRRTNRRLHFQKRQIESQAEDLRNINESLQKANIKIKQKNALIEEKNEDLTRLNNEKNHIIGILAHDLRNPLATAISMNEPIQSQHNELSEEQYEAGSIITRALRRMNEMINKILDIRAIETKKLNLDIQRTNMFFVIQQVCELFRDRFAKKKIKCQFDIRTEEAYAHIDFAYMVQVLENLVSNAIKFSFPGSSITIGLFEKENTIVLFVKDSGPGIKPEEMEKLFGKFQKLSAKHTSGETSTGLGLSIVKKYVEEMHGSVWCESTYRKGATFFVSFAKANEVLA